MSDSTELLDDEISLVRFIEYNSPNLSSIGVTLVSEEISKALSWDELDSILARKPEISSAFSWTVYARVVSATVVNSIYVELTIAAASAASLILVALTFALSVLKNHQLRKEIIHRAMNLIERETRRELSGRERAEVIRRLLELMDSVPRNKAYIGTKLKAGPIELLVSSGESDDTR